MCSAIKPVTNLDGSIMESSLILKLVMLTLRVALLTFKEQLALKVSGSWKYYCFPINVFVLSISG